MIDLGRLAYQTAYEAQVMHLEEVLASREAGEPEIGRILLVEHPPTITVGRRPGSAKHLVASAAELAAKGVEVVESDRGGDITYHGPGQLVVYPIVDLNRLNLGVHAYMRLLESAVIEACEQVGVSARHEAGATGVWVERRNGLASKVCAMGVRVRRWVTMHGLAINVDPDLSHFDLIVPCGLTGRSVTSLRRELADGGDTQLMDAVKRVLADSLVRELVAQAHAADAARRAANLPATA